MPTSVDRSNDFPAVGSAKIKPDFAVNQIAIKPHRGISIGRLDSARMTTAGAKHAGGRPLLALVIAANLVVGSEQSIERPRLIALPEEPGPTSRSAVAANVAVDVGRRASQAPIVVRRIGPIAANPRIVDLAF